MPLVSSTWAGSHVQLKPEPKSQHWPSFMPRIADATVGAVSQRFPSVPDGQAQKKSPSKLMQLALFRHGCDSQKLKSFSHLRPVQPMKKR